MASNANRSILNNRVDELLGKLNTSQNFPVDLDRLAQLAGIIEIQRVPMIPEGVLSLTTDGFVVYLQDNFTSSLGNVRQRFTPAHELCHTFFYDKGKEGKLRRKRIPEVELEFLCNVGAGWILIPERWMNAWVKVNKKVSSATDLLGLSQDFGVSLEVLFRRLQEHPSAWIEDDHAFVLAKGQSVAEEIKGISFGPWLQTQFYLPALYEQVDTWLARAGTRLKKRSNTQFEHSSPLGLIQIEKEILTQKESIYTVRSMRG